MQEGANETSHLGRALALALCTLWGNILFLDGSGSVLLSAPFASRMASMAFSVVGFCGCLAGRSLVHSFPDALPRRPSGRVRVSFECGVILAFFRSGMAA